WDPVRPLDGEGDWLERVCWAGGSPGALTDLFAARRGRRRPTPIALKPIVSTHEAQRRQAVARLSRWIARQPERAEPALAPLLERELRRLERRRRGQAIAKRAPALSRSLRQRLYPYQRQGLLRFLQEGRLLLADDMGLGKTAQ